MSETLRHFLQEFDVTQIRTSPYHPQTNGSCERFHRTMKLMIHALADKFEDAWDECLPWILFAYREIPVETLGYSPFELMFGRSIRGPLSLIKTTWLQTQNSLDTARPNVVKFMLDLREKLRECQELSLDVANEAKSNSKVWYDRHVRKCTFDIGEQVLVLLPMPGKPLLAKYQGPYRITGKIGPVDYVISTSTKRKSQRVCHNKHVETVC